MKELIIKEYNDNDYLQVKECVLDENKYYIYFDIETQGKAIICDSNQEVVNDKNIINRIVYRFFSVDNEILYEDSGVIDFGELFGELLSDNSQSDNSTEVEFVDKAEKELIIKKMKKLFFRKFGTASLSEEELDERIKKEIKRVGFADLLSEGVSVGEYNRKKRIMYIDYSYRNTKKGDKIFFHEFIHGITNPGAIKSITIGEGAPLETLHYGLGINEGLASYIENMRDINKWGKIYKTGQYDYDRTLVEHIRRIYQNFCGDDFILQFIKDPEGTLPRINKMFEAETLGQEGKQEELKLLSMRKALKFIIEFDEMSKDRNSQTKKEKFEKLEDQLLDLYIQSIATKTITTKKELYDALYEIEGFGLNLSMKSNQIEDLKIKLIQEFLKTHPRVKLYRLKKDLPESIETSSFSQEEMLLANIFGEPAIDLRHAGVFRSIEEVQRLQEISKSEIGEAFGTSVSTRKKDAVETVMRRAKEEKEGANIGKSSNN